MFKTNEGEQNVYVKDTGRRYVRTATEAVLRAGLILIRAVVTRYR
jgi:hypothetical protein